MNTEIIRLFEAGDMAACVRLAETEKEDRVLAVAAHRLGDHERAEAAYRRTLERNAQDLEMAAGFGELCLTLGRYDEAAIWLRVAIELDPTSSDPAGSRARLLVIKHKRRYRL